MIEWAHVQNINISNYKLDFQFAYFLVPISNSEVQKKQIGSTEVLDISHMFNLNFGPNICAAQHRDSSPKFRFNMQLSPINPCSIFKAISISWVVEYNAFLWFTININLFWYELWVSYLPEKSFLNSLLHLRLLLHSVSGFYLNCIINIGDVQRV